MKGNRPERVAELLKRELAMLIPRELDDPRAHHVTLTSAVVAADLKSARVYFTLLAGEAESERAAKALNGASGILRRALKPRLTMRSVPELRFYYDESVERGDRVSRLIAQALKEDQEPPKK